MTERPELWRDAGDFGLLSTADVAQLSGFSPNAVRRAISDGELVASILRGEHPIWPEDFRIWIDSRRVKATQKELRQARRSVNAGSGSTDRLRALEGGQ